MNEVHFSYVEDACEKNYEETLEKTTENLMWALSEEPAWRLCEDAYENRHEEKPVKAGEDIFEEFLYCNPYETYYWTEPDAWEKVNVFVKAEDGNHRFVLPASYFESVLEKYEYDIDFREYIPAA